jgi:hypothetical protein
MRSMPSSACAAPQQARLRLAAVAVESIRRLPHRGMVRAHVDPGEGRSARLHGRAQQRVDLVDHGLREVAARDARLVRHDDREEPRSLASRTASTAHG